MGRGPHVSIVRVTVTGAELRRGDKLAAIRGVQLLGSPVVQPDGRLQVTVRTPHGRRLLHPRPDARYEVRRAPRAGDLVRHESTSGGTLVQVIDCRHPDSVVEPAVGDQWGPRPVEQRWATSCVPHGGWIVHSTLEDAINNAATQSVWCDGCGGNR